MQLHTGDLVGSSSHIQGKLCSIVSLTQRRYICGHFNAYLLRIISIGALNSLAYSDWIGFLGMIDSVEYQI